MEDEREARQMQDPRFRVSRLGFYHEGSRAVAKLEGAGSYLMTVPEEPCSHLNPMEGTYPPIQARSFENVEAVEDSSALMQRNTVYIPDSCQENPSITIHEFVFLVSHSPERLALTLEGERAQAWNGIMLFQLGATNWYHWLVEILPMAFLAERLSDDYAIYPLVVPKKIAQIKNFRDSLELFLGGRKILLIDEKGLRFRELIVIDPISNGPFNLREGVWPSREMYSQNSKLLLEFRKAILERLNIRNKGQGDRVFFARRNDRRGYNQGEIEDIAVRNGFHLVYMEELSFREQVELMFGAKVVVGASGAAFSNVLFCQEGARILSWMIPQYRGFSSFSNLARAVGADMRYIFSEPQEPIQSTWEGYRAKYHLDPVVFENALKLALFSEDY